MVLVGLVLSEIDLNLHNYCLAFLTSIYALTALVKWCRMTYKNIPKTIELTIIDKRFRLTENKCSRLAVQISSVHLGNEKK